MKLSFNLYLLMLTITYNGINILCMQPNKQFSTPSPKLLRLKDFINNKNNNDKRKEAKKIIRDYQEKSKKIKQLRAQLKDAQQLKQLQKELTQNNRNNNKNNNKNHESSDIVAGSDFINNISLETKEIPKLKEQLNYLQNLINSSKEIVTYAYEVMSKTSPKSSLNFNQNKSER